MISKDFQNIKFINQSGSLIFLQFIVIILFALYKYFQLHNAPFYDEAWVYYPAIKCLFVEGLSAIFSGECLSFTRGHPLFFHLLAWMWAKVFGISILSMHTFALSISLFFLLYLRHTLSRLFKPGSVLVIVILLCLQSIFIIQSSMLLPEVMLCFLLYISLYNFYLERITYFTIFFVLACMTKEVAIIYLPAFLMISIYNKKRVFIDVNVLLSFVVIIIIWFGYLFMQKQLYGWYFLPDHTNTINLKIDSVAKNWQYILHFLFRFQGRIFLVIGLSLVLIFQRNKKSAFIFFCISALFVLIGNFSKMHSLFFLSGAFLLFILIFFNIKQIVKHAQFLNLLLGLIFVSTFFFSFVFFTIRYLLPAVFGFLIISVVLVIEFAVIPKIIYLPIIIILLVLIYSDLRSNQKMGDTDMGSLQAIHAQHDLYQFLDSTVSQKSNICTNSFLIWCELGGKYDYYNPPPIDSHFLGFNNRCSLFIYSNIEGENINPYDTLQLMQTKNIKYGEASIMVSQKRY